MPPVEATDGTAGGSAADGPAEPLGDDEIDRLLGPLTHACGAALAVSGGADSTALMLAARRWLARHGGPPLLVLTLDHGLRPGSADEAAAVARAAAALGLAHETLRWEGPKPTGNLQAGAREARYRLLSRAARRAGMTHLLTAHHLEDQAETFLLRIARGSGLQGLAGMPARRDLDGLVLMRPFVGLPKARLVATCVAAGQPWIEDPSNADPRFARARLRALGRALAAEGLTPARLAATAARLRRAQDAVDWIVAGVLEEAAEIHQAGFVRLRVAGLLDVPEEAALRALSRLLQAVGGRGYGPRLDRLERLWETLRTGAVPRCTLAGCLVAPAGDRLLIAREAGRSPPPALRLAPGDEEVWDGRFRVRLGPGAAGPVTVAALGDDPVPGAPVQGVPRAARRMVPAFRRGGALVAVPSLGHAGGAPDGEGTVADFLGFSREASRNRPARRDVATM